MLAVLFFAVAGCRSAGDNTKWVPLFDGRSLDGWHTLPGGKWEVQDGVIVGTSSRAEKRHGLLVSDKRYGDFTVRLKFKVLKGDSGFYFRVDKVESAVGVHGFQAEIDANNDIGGLYETGGRAWVVKPSPEEVKKYFKPQQWNQMTVSAHGRHIVVHVNGHKTAELKNDPGRLQGHLALQLHGSKDMNVMFKDIEMLVPKSKLGAKARAYGAEEMPLVFEADFDDGNFDGWSATDGRTGDPVLPPHVVSSPQGYSLRGVGSGYSQDPGLNVWLSHPLSLSNVGELKIEFRAKSGPQWPNCAAMLLFSGNDYYRVTDYGEGNTGAWFYSYINGTEFSWWHDLGNRAYEWHDFAWTHDADGWWSLSIDGVVESPNFHQDNQLTSFDRISSYLLRNQSEIEWVRISVPESAVTVEIDIKPGSYPNAVNLGSHGLTPVAIFSMVGFDATSVEPNTVNLAGAPVAIRGKDKFMAHEEDVDGDGMVDLVVQVVTADINPALLQQDGDVIYAVLTGNTSGGEAIEGEDEIVIVPPK